MVLQFLGADREVTGSCHYVKFGDKHFLVDCGMEQGPDLYVNQEMMAYSQLRDEYARKQYGKTFALLSKAQKDNLLHYIIS